MPTNLPPSSTETRSRALYALSGTLKHNEKAVELLDQYEGWGWEVLKGGLSGEYPVVSSPVFMSGCDKQPVHRCTSSRH